MWKYDGKKHDSILWQKEMVIQVIQSQKGKMKRKWREKGRLCIWTSV